MDERAPRRKGYVFSVDALMSIVVLFILLTSISFFSSRVNPETLSLVSLQVKTNDMLVVLDKLGYLSNKSGASMSGFMNGTFGPSVAWRMDVEYYNYTMSNDTFTLESEILIGEDSAGRDDIASATRVFIVDDNVSVVNYGRVILMTWLR